MSALSLAKLMGPRGQDYVRALEAAQAFLRAHDTPALLARVGRVIDDLPAFEPIEKRRLQRSFSGAAPGDDLLAGQGLFYLTEGRKLFLDCTAGHYQMTWGYHPPGLAEAIWDADRAGIVWDNHSNIPQAPVKRLAERLVELANPPGTADPLDTVLPGICTGSVACSSALKMQLVTFARSRGADAVPALIVMDGNYHGTDMIAQNLRGMWPRFVRNLDVVAVEPNDPGGLRDAFRRSAGRVAAFWAEPILMNREAILLEPAYLQLARQLCDEAGAPMCIDEIQTGFWQKEVFAAHLAGVVPDMLICGKGMTAGFHPLSAVVYKRRFDCLEQYDAISTNGQAALPALAALCNVEMIVSAGARLDAVAARYEKGMRALAEKHGRILLEYHGRGLISALKFRDRQAAIDFHRASVAAGLWTRAHAYHEGHSTLLTKLALAADEAIADYVVARLDELLAKVRN